METISPKLKGQIKQAIAILSEGGIVVYPTDTVYGLGADAANEAAVRRVFDLKHRPLAMPLPLLITGDLLVGITSSLPRVAHCLLQNFWPGALTLVVRKNKSVSDIITAGATSVAVRVPAHPVVLAIITGLGRPIIGTSANIHGQPSPVTGGEARQQLGGKVDLLIDGGRCPGGVESTIVDVTGNIPVIIREGAISPREIQRACEIKITARKGI